MVQCAGRYAGVLARTLAQGHPAVACRPQTDATSGKTMQKSEECLPNQSVVAAREMVISPLLFTFTRLSITEVLVLDSCRRIRCFYRAWTCPHWWCLFYEVNFVLLCQKKPKLTLQSSVGSTAAVRKMFPTPPFAQLHNLDNIISDTFGPTGPLEHALQDIQC